MITLLGHEENVEHVRNERDHEAAHDTEAEAEDAVDQADTAVENGIRNAHRYQVNHDQRH